MTPLKLAKSIWASPCSLVGLMLASMILLAGGSVRRRSGALEICYRPSRDACGRRARRLRFRGIVFGQVILAVSEEDLRRIGPHERVHVQQYERWGLLFFLAYPASSLWQWLRGRDPYWDNGFEIQARERGDGERRAHPL